MNHKLLEVKSLKKYFPVMSGILRREVGQVHALEEIDFTLDSGEVLGIVGESGCGKSTLGRAVLRLVEPTSGEVVFQGRNILKFGPSEMEGFRKEAQIVFQDPFSSLNPRKTVRECVGEGLLYHGLVKNISEQKERVAEILSQVGLSADSMYRYPHQFSGGQQQRICIGRALAMNPRLIVCDEALSALDVSVQAQILNLLQELKAKFKLSYLFISHDLSAVRYICDRVIVLYLGRVMEVASTADLFSNPRHPYTQALLSAIPKDHPGKRTDRMLLKGDVPSAMHPPSGCPFRTRCPFAQSICSEPPPRRSPKEGHEYWCILD